MILKNGWLWYLNFILFLNLSGYTLTEAKSNKIQSIDTVDLFLDTLDSTKPTIIKTYSENCPFCTMIAPKFEKIASNQKYNKRISFAQANGKSLQIHKHVPAKSNGKYKIPGYPTFIFINNGNIVDLLIGGDEKKLLDKVDSFLKSL